MAFEEEFGIEIPDDAAEKIQTVGDAIRFINEQREVLIAVVAHKDYCDAAGSRHRHGHGDAAW